MNIFLAITLLLIPIGIKSNIHAYENMEEINANKKLLDVTHDYLTFINRLSQGEVFPDQDDAASIIAWDCQKIFNGKLHTQKREDFVSDLIEVNKTHGCWTVKPVDIISSPENMCVTLRLMIDIEKLGAFTAIVILRFNSNYLISEINEVFNKLEGYNFD